MYDPGIYWHIEFVKSLETHLSFYNESDIPAILEIESNTDGLSLSRSNPHQFWPIQYRVTNIAGFKPLIVGVYKGPGKPSNCRNFFNTFIDEVEKARQLGGILANNKRIPFKLKSFVADAPARALILNHYGHNSTNPCSKCKVTGFRFENRTTVYLTIPNVRT